MENRIRIREAIYRQKMLGDRSSKKEIALRLFPESTIESAYNKLNNYEKGKSNSMSPDAIRRICEELDVDANYLFGIQSMFKDE